MPTSWYYASLVRNANRLTPEEKQQEQERKAHDKKYKTQPLSQRFYCPNTYMLAGFERVCGYWPPEHVWWKNGEPHCDVHRTPLEIHPGKNLREVEKEQRALRRRRKLQRNASGLLK